MYAYAHITVVTDTQPYPESRVQSPIYVITGVSPIPLSLSWTFFRPRVGGLSDDASGAEVEQCLMGDRLHVRWKIMQNVGPEE